MVDTSGNYTFDYNLTNVTPSINDSPMFMNFTSMTWEDSIMLGFHTWMNTYGDWFWLIPVVVVPLMFLVKYGEVPPAAFMLTLTSALCISVVPPATVAVVYALYSFLILGVFAIIISAITRR